jgi:hypothetical protein
LRRRDRFEFVSLTQTSGEPARAPGRDITVSSGICSRLAISRYCISETTAMSSTSRNCGGIPSIAAAKWWSVNTFLLALLAAAQASRIS